MAELLDEMVALEIAARRCIPKLATDPILLKCSFNVESIILLDVEYLTNSGKKVVVLEPCGPLNSYIAEILREMLAEEGFDAYIDFRF